MVSAHDSPHLSRSHGIDYKTIWLSLDRGWIRRLLAPHPAWIDHDADGGNAGIRKKPKDAGPNAVDSLSQSKFGSKTPMARRDSTWVHDPNTGRLKSQRKTKSRQLITLCGTRQPI